MPLNLSFDNLQNAFAGKSSTDLNRAYILFKAIDSNNLVSSMEPLTRFSLNIGLPINWIIKGTIFKHFVGGETATECQQAIDKLWINGVGSILDYSVEGSEDETFHDDAGWEIVRNIERAKDNPKIPFTVFKPTGLISFALLEKVTAGKKLTDEEDKIWRTGLARIDKVCDTAHKAGVRIFLDAEESWIQKAIDDICDSMMEKYNKQSHIVFNTLQLYRTDRLKFLETSYEKAAAGNYFLGVKLVRGAYMEKERERALQYNYPSPIHVDKAGSDRDYDASLLYCVEHIDRIAVCAGTHNENSSYYLAELLEKNNIPHNHPHIWFSQLLGMSDHISNNLAKSGYNVCKYVPYGPVKSVMPYLFRRAKENTSVKGQTGRELSLILKEKERRKGK